MSLFANLPKEINIVEVGPRDGLQNETIFIPTDVKLRFIDSLIEAGLKTIEMTSFVSPKAIPQTKDSMEVAKSVLEKYKNRDDLNFPCLVPNEKGWMNANSLGVKEIAIFSAASNEFNKKNIKTDIQGSFERLAPVAKKALAENVKVRGYLSTAFGCPYEGEVPFDKVLDVIKRFDDIGVYEISLGDTIGIAIPKQVHDLLATIDKHRGLHGLAMHFHDTRGMALANILTSLQWGMSTFDSSAAGLGGCPYAKGASGNVATEEVSYLLESFGLSTGIDSLKLKQSSVEIFKILGRASSTKLNKA